jgi:hypothetical protein
MSNAWYRSGGGFRNAANSAAALLSVCGNQDDARSISIVSAAPLQIDGDVQLPQPRKPWDFLCRDGYSRSTT